MAMINKPATWLDLAAAPRWGREHLELMLHPLSVGCGECFVLSLSGRIVCSGDGKLTVFRSREAVERFLLLLELEEPPLGEPVSLVGRERGGQYCLRLCGNSLCACSADADESLVEPSRESRRYRSSMLKPAARSNREAMM